MEVVVEAKTATIPGVIQALVQFDPRRARLVGYGPSVGSTYAVDQSARAEGQIRFAAAELEGESRAGTVFKFEALKADFMTGFQVSLDQDPGAYLAPEVGAQAVEGATPGDCDANGSVDVGDLTRIGHISLGVWMAMDAAMFARCDYDRNAFINVLDMRGVAVELSGATSTAGPGPGGSGPGDSVPADSVPGDTVPGDTGPGDTGLGGSGPGDSVPADSVPGDTVPGDTGPGDTGPGPNAPNWPTIATHAFRGALTDGGWVSNGRISITTRNGRSVAQYLYPAGWKDGEAPGNLSHRLHGGRELYIRFWVERSPNWAYHPVNDKVFYVDDTDYGGGGDPFTLVLAQEYVRAARQGPLGSVNYEAGPGTSWDGLVNRASGRTPLTPGQRHEIETLLVTGMNGEIHVWVNGVKNIEYIGVPMSDVTPSWDYFKFEPVYGGYAEGPTWDLTTEQHMYLDNVYVSGR